MAKQNTLTLIAAKLDGIPGFNVTGFVPFSDFADEKAGAEYTVYLDADGKTVDKDTPGAVAEVRKASANRNFRRNFTEPTIVWSDGKMRTISVRMKANNAMLPEQYDASKSEAADKRLLTQAASASVDSKRKLLEQLKAELGE